MTHEWKAHWYPTYHKANRSKVVYTRSWHFHWYGGQPCSHGKQRGVTIKHRRRDGLWRHVQFRKMRYSSSESKCGTVNHFEICWHLSAEARSRISRIKGSKRYFRFKVCL